MGQDIYQQEDARRHLRGMCGFKKDGYYKLRVCWMEMEVE